MTSSTEHSHSRLKLLSYNIQAGVGSTRYHHYLTHSWKHVLPHGRRMDNLDRIADVIAEHDIVALQETDAGSLRSNFVNQTEYLAHKGDFPFWYYKVNRDMGKLGQFSNSVLSKYRPTKFEDYKLPGWIPGRGALMARYGARERPLVILILHLALGKRARLNQLSYIAEIVNEYRDVVLMGDMNCQSDSAEMKLLFNRTRLLEPREELRTFPSWRPVRKIDHILVTPSLNVHKVHVLQHAYSDHLPVSMEIGVPDDIHLPA